ncbi:MAG: cupin domain-containing protein [Proteobacteria bacterium]|nr:cupin domain-containing protein [Pseudomonadota bacterium]MDA0927392.1 cupin domain-containing protein [Pseudomonadota bacterium]
MTAKDFNPADFLRNYWQQKPVLIRSFLKDFSDPLDGDELGGLALAEEVESRLVHSEDGSYQLSHGPFPEHVLTALPDRDWTLLVQSVDLWIEDVAGLKAHFDFIPSWRIDDVMVSFAAPGGGVGPHFDRYDVFLLQGSGSRHWRLGQLCDAETPVDTSTGLCLLKEFKQEQEFTLHCGDVLYIPPGWAHWGISGEAGLCYSIGFRAPSHEELLEEFSTLLMSHCSPDQRYIDHKPAIPALAGEIGKSELQSLWLALQGKLQSQSVFQEAFGNLVTRPRYPALHKEYAQRVTAEALHAALAAGEVLSRHPGSRFAFVAASKPTGGLPALPLRLFADGECFELTAGQLELVHALCNATIGNSELISLPTIIPNDPDTRLLLALLAQGSLLLQPAGESE